MTARILVVDDIPANVKLLEVRLLAEYFEVLTASNGADACLHSLDRRQGNPGQFSQRPLVNSQQRPCRSHLERRDHVAMPCTKQDK